MSRHNDLIRLVDAVWLLCKKTCTPGIACPDAICCEMWEEFKDIPSVDAVQVIRCRDCKHWCDNDGFNHDKGAECEVMRMWMQPGDYCSYAKKREGSDGNTDRSRKDR